MWDFSLSLGCVDHTGRCQCPAVPLSDQLTAVLGLVKKLSFGRGFKATVTEPQATKSCLFFLF